MKIALELGEELRCLLEEGEKHQIYSTHSRAGEIERESSKEKNRSSSNANKSEN